jgi:hypothetical protein
VREWARLYQTPLWLAAVFIGLLALFAVTPDPGRTATKGPDTASEPTPGPGECVICGIDQQCDPTAGRCVFVKVTPLPCVEHAKFDEKAGFCLPTGAPTPVPQPVFTEEPGRFPGTERESRRSRIDEDNSLDDRRRDEERADEENR